MRERQKNVCGICKTPGKPLCVDHCHATGKVRGLLCRDCNLGLGNYKDNPVFTRAATAYLEAARCDDGNQRSAAGEGLDSISRSRVRRAPARDAGGSLEAANRGAVFAGFYARGCTDRRRRGEISRESTGKFRADHMSASSAAVRTAAKQHAMGRGAHRRTGGGWTRWPSAGGARYRQTGGRPFRSAADIRTRSKRRSR